MIYTKIRLGLVILFIGLGVVLQVERGLQDGAGYLYLAGFLLLITHFLFGNVWMAFNLLKRGNKKQAWGIIRQVRFPALLLPRNRAYFYFTRGMIRLQEEALGEAKPDLERALKLGLSTANDRALVNLNLAHIHYVKQNYDASRQYLDSAKAAEPKDLLIKQNLSKLEAALQSLS